MRKTNCLILVTTLVCPALVHAVNQSSDIFPVGLWSTSHYKLDDKTGTVTKKPLELDVCIRSNGTWQTLNSTDGMQGHWIRESNDIHLTGNGALFAGTGDITLSVPYNLMTGNWQSWPIKNPKSSHLSYTSRWELKQSRSCKP